MLPVPTKRSVNRWNKHALDMCSCKDFLIGSRIDGFGLKKRTDCGLCDNLSGFADFENSADCGSTVDFDPDSGL